MKINYFFFLLILIKIIDACHWKCRECTEETSDDYHHYCTSCIDNTNFMVGGSNCYFSHELPGLYFDSSTNKYEFCSAGDNCYECFGSSTTCKSCKRGAQYNENLNQCDLCDTNYYINVLNNVENCQGGEQSTFTCNLYITKCTNINIDNDNYECPRDYPLFLENDNNYHSCVMEVYIQDYHSISNQIIKTQWLNKRTKIGENRCLFVTSDFSSQGDLIIETNIYDEYSIDKNRYFYGIKSNGRLLFYDNDNDNFIEQKAITADTTYNKFESQLKRIKFVNDENDYYFNFNYLSTEIYDFENNQVKGYSKEILFRNYEWSSKIISILELNNERNIYLFSLIAKIEETYYIVFYKYKFYNQNLLEATSFENVKTVINNEFSVSPARIINCIEISTFNIIECFYINSEHYYVISLFDESSLKMIKTTVIDDTSLIYEDTIDYDNYYFQCIWLKNEISILAYIIDPESDLIYFQFKEIKYQNKQYIIDDHLLVYRKITINSNKKYTISSFYYISQLKKINDNRFCLITTSKNFFDSYIILFDFYNYHDSSLFVRYYHIPLRLYDIREFEHILGVNFNGFLGVVYTNKKVSWYESIQYFSIFSYINSIDSDLITLDESSTLRLRDYINENYIENNLFGVILYGIKILKLPKNIGVYYYSQNKNAIVHENDILDSDDSIIFVYDYEDLVRDDLITHTIEIAGVVQEPTYEEFNKYPEDIECYASETQQLFYIQRILIGKTSFYNFKIPSTLIGTNIISCKSNCQICYNTFCVKCLDNFIVKENPNSCVMNTPIDGYYLDQNSNTYMKCYESCKTCSDGPLLYNQRLDVEDSNCDTCVTNYYKVIDTNNCLHKDNPPTAHYLDLNLGLFVNCYENCRTCNQFKKNSTYFSCLSCDNNNRFYEKSSNCLNCSYIGKIVNYYQYKCIDEVPDGYFLLDEESKRIDKCYITCKHCNIQGNSNNHLCTECAEAYPYNYNNGQKCLDDCSKENLFLESSNNKCYSDCSHNNLNGKTSNYKNKCISKDEAPKNYILDENNNFVSKCDPQKDYEFNNECYNNCPDGTELDLSVKDKKLCICKNLYYLNGEDYICINSNVCPTDYPYLKIGTSECSNCPVVYKGKCYLKCPEGTCLTQININLATCVDKLDDTKILGGLCFDDFLRILDGIDNAGDGNIVMNESPGISINIYTSKINLDEAENKNENLTFIYLDECENKLREYYKLNPSQKICIISVDLLTKWSNKTTNDFDYEIYLDNGTQIQDLSPCYNYPISISSPIINLNLINYEYAINFAEQGYDIYNLSSEFYNEKCTAAYINGNDIIIEDRRNDIYPYNASFCPNGCELEYVGINTKRLNCSCNISFTTEDLPEEENENNQLLVQTDESYIAYLLDMLNYKLFGCYIIFGNLSVQNYLSNVAFYLGIITILFNIIGCCIFYCSFLFKIRIEIFKLIPNDILLYEKGLEYQKRFNNSNNIDNSDQIIVKNQINDQKDVTSIPINNIISNSCKELKQISIDNISKNKKSQKNKRNKIKRSKFVTESASLNINKNNNKISEENEDYFDIEKKFKDKIIKNDDDINPNDYNELPYTQAIRLDNRNFFRMFLSMLKMKIDIINIIFYPEDYTHRSLLLSIYLLDFLFNYFMNALLYSDDVVSQKYHNNGTLDFITSFSLSLASNIISSIIIWIIEKLTNYHEYLETLVKSVYNEKSFMYLFKKIYDCLKIKVLIYFILNFLISIFITYYLFIFCIIYKKSQISLLSNYFLGVGESLLKSFGISLISCIFRFISLKYQFKQLYRTSVYLNDLF